MINNIEIFVFNSSPYFLTMKSQVSLINKEYKKNYCINTVCVCVCVSLQSLFVQIPYKIVSPKTTAPSCPKQVYG